MARCLIYVAGQAFEEKLAALPALLFGLVRLAPDLDAPFLPDTAPSQVSTDPADDLNFEIDDLLPLVDAAEMPGLAHVGGPAGDHRDGT